MEFTNEEKLRIDQLYGHDFKDATPEDIQLIIKWERDNAQREQENRAKAEAIAKRTAAQLEEDRKTAELARDNLRELHDMAVSRLEGLYNGK